LFENIDCSPLKFSPNENKIIIPYEFIGGIAREENKLEDKTEYKTSVNIIFALLFATKYDEDVLCIIKYDFEGKKVFAQLTNEKTVDEESRNAVEKRQYYVINNKIISIKNYLDSKF